jgi:hypothetical protein
MLNAIILIIILLIFIKPLFFNQKKESFSAIPPTNVYVNIEDQNQYTIEGNRKLITNGYDFEIMMNRRTSFLDELINDPVAHAYQKEYIQNLKDSIPADKELFKFAYAKDMNYIPFSIYTQPVIEEQYKDAIDTLYSYQYNEKKTKIK